MASAAGAKGGVSTMTCRHCRRPALRFLAWHEWLPRHGTLKCHHCGVVQVRPISDEDLASLLGALAKPE